ncbi:MAG: hypothetical protein H7308_19025 [Chthonomonadaceae bacterium]|nr:hypothetical protein [Chthonomonadaceae bacterium]
MSTPLAIFALDTKIPPLRTLWSEAKEEEMPLQLGVFIAGEATEEELDAPEWESVFVRWTEPEIHDIALLETYTFEEPEGEELSRKATELLSALPQDSSRFVLEQHLLNVKRLYVIQTLPALLDDEDHAGWDGIDLVLRVLADVTGGVIYAEGEGFYSAEGTPFYTPDLLLGNESEDEDEEE